jgi:preprotein translocase subunit YajC
MGAHILAVAPALAASSTKSGSSSYTLLIFLVLIFGVMYFVMIRPQRNRQRQAQQTQRQVENGTRVRTTAGMYGTVVDGDADNVLVEFAPGVQIKMMRRAIMNVVPDDEPAGFNPTTAASGQPDVGTPTENKSGNREDLSI